MSVFLDKFNFKKANIWFFILAFLGISFFYDVHEIMFFRPQSIHIWRQTDCLSITQNYYQRDTPFLEPEIYNFISNNNTSGKTAGEFPFIYYLVAQLWKIFGKHEFLYRLFTFLTAFIGLFHLFRLSNKILNNQIQSLFIGLILFTSTVFVFYGTNFLPNIHAFSLSLTGWYFIYTFAKKGEKLRLWTAILFFTLAMLLKVSSGISFVALFIWAVYETMRLPEKRQLFTQPAKHLIPFFVAICIVISWYAYASWYNNTNYGRYTFNNIWPIWELSSAKITEILITIRKVWKHEFSHSSLIYSTIALWLVLLTFYRRLSRFELWLLLSIPAGSILYLLLWFQALGNHDYYYIDIFILIPLVWLIFFKTFGKTKWISHPSISVILVAFLIFNVIQCEKKLKARFTGWMNEWHEIYGKTAGELEPVLRKAGIDPEDLVISIPDLTINATLYLINQRGYTDFGSNFKDPDIFNDRISKGAKYLIVHDTTILKDSFMEPYTQHLICSYKNVNVYDLKPYIEKNNIDHQ